MKVLLIHNKYQHAGGEDLVFEMESGLLRDHGHVVEKVIFDNHDIRDWFSKLTAGVGIIYNRQSAKALEKRIREVEPDVIHVHNFFPLASPSVLFAAKRFNIPVVVTLHNFRLICPSGVFLYHDKIYNRSLHSVFPLDAIVKGVYRNSVIDTAAVALMASFHNLAGTWKSKVDRFIILSHFAKNTFRESKVGIHDWQFAVKPNFAEDHGEGGPTRDNFYLYAGRLSSEKGIGLALESAAAFGFNLVVVGDGPLRGEVQRYVARYSNIRWFGFQPKGCVISLLKQCRALLVPSVCYEGFPLAVIEAFSTGTPVIASRLGSLAEIITDNVNGLHFTAGDKDDLFSKVSMLETQPTVCELLGYNARQTYLWHYTPEKNYQMLMNIYHDVMERQAVDQSSVLTPA